MPTRASHGVSRGNRTMVARAVRSSPAHRQVHQDERCRLRREARGERLRQRRAHALAHEHERPLLVRASQQPLQLLDGQVRAEWLLARLAPAQARTVVAAHACRAGHRRLHVAPRRRQPGRRRIEHHGWRALAVARDVELVAADVHHAPGPRVGAAFDRGGHALVRHADQRDESQERHDSQGPPAAARRVHELERSTRMSARGPCDPTRVVHDSRRSKPARRSSSTMVSSVSHLEWSNMPDQASSYPNSP